MKNFEKKKAIVLFNLCGPDKLESVKPFLFNLFNDKAIIDLPQPFRFLLAKFISSRRNKKAQKIYQQIGGKSPIFDITLAQGEALEKELSFAGKFKVFIAMRYWHPLTEKTAAEVLTYEPSQIILLPLYPQFSSTTSRSSLAKFIEEFPDKTTPLKVVCCYPTDNNFIDSHVNLIKRSIARLPLPELRFLFSAHGLPQKLIDAGDPYVFQVTETTKAIVEKIAEEIDYRICYQSKVGPLKWTQPSLEHELKKTILDGKIPVIIPVAFVSDHSETLVELDIEYRDIAAKLGAKNYIRVPALNIDSSFIKSLAEICQKVSKESEDEIFCGKNKNRICPQEFGFCPNQNCSTI